MQSIRLNPLLSTAAVILICLYFGARATCLEEHDFAQYGKQLVFCDVPCRYSCLTPCIAGSQGTCSRLVVCTVLERRGLLFGGNIPRPVSGTLGCQRLNYPSWRQLQ